MEYRIEVLASFKKEAKRLRKHYASFIDDYENKAERESISLKEIEELLRKNGLKYIDIVIIFCQKYLFFQLLL